MKLAGGEVALPVDLLCSNRSGQSQVAPPEQPVRLSRMSTAALIRLAEDLTGLAAVESMATDGGLPGVADVADLWARQAEAELALRFAEEAEACGELDDEPQASREEIPDERDADDWKNHAE